MTLRRAIDRARHDLETLLERFHQRQRAAILRRHTFEEAEGLLRAQRTALATMVAVVTATLEEARTVDEVGAIVTRALHRLNSGHDAVASEATVQ